MQARYKCNESDNIAKNCPKSTLLTTKLYTTPKDAEFVEKVIVETKGKSIEVCCALDFRSPINFIKKTLWVFSKKNH